MPNPDLPLNSTGIVLNLLQFDKTVSLNECGLLYNEVYNPHFDEYDAIANVNVDLNTFSNMFCFQSDYIDVNDISGTDVKYYVLAPKIQSFIPNLGSSIVGTNPVVSFASTGSTEPNQLVGKDFTRYLASLLFNTPYGTDLFINESALVDSVSSALLTAWSYCMTDLQNVSNESTNQYIPLVGNVPAKYLTNNFSGVQNICRELFLQLVSKAPARFTNLPEILVEDANVLSAIREDSNLNYYYLPFVNNDTVTLRVKVYPCEHQPTFGLSTTDTTKFETVNGDTHLKGRTYLINMILTDNSTSIPPPPIPPNTLSILVVGKSALSTDDVLNNLPIIHDGNILSITPTATKINATTIRVDVAYTILPDTDSSLMLDVGVSFSNVYNWYNDNIASIQIAQFGGIPLYGQGSQFQGLLCGLTFSATDIPLISPGTSLSSAFENMYNFNENVSFLNNWGLLNVSDMSNMFSQCIIFNNGSTSNDGTHPLTFTTSSSLLVVNNMFMGCSNFNQTVSISNTTRVINMIGMFAGCSIFNNGSTSNDGTHPLTFTTSSSLKLLNGMFVECYNFNQTVSISNMTRVTFMSGMFESCIIFNNGSTSNDGNHPLTFTTSNNEPVHLNNMFLECSNFNQTVSISNMTRVSNMSGMFEICSIFNNGSTSNDGTHPLTFTTSSSLLVVTNMFFGCSNFNQTVSISNTTSVTFMSRMFAQCSIFNNGDTSNVRLKPITWYSPNLSSVQSMFHNCSVFNQQVTLNQPQTANISSMFDGCPLYVL